MAIKRNAQTGKIIAKRFSMAQIEEAVDLQGGYCRACGAYRDCCEPDARRYRCDDCDMDQVYGAEELVLMGQVNA